MSPGADGRGWRHRPLEELLAAHDLTGLPEAPLTTDGWSGSRFSWIRRGTDRFVLKRSSPATDWIVRATSDATIREAVVAATPDEFPLLGRIGAPGLPYLGAAWDGDAAAILMPDLSNELIAWERPGHRSALSIGDIDRVLDAIARLHAQRWWITPDRAEIPWCPLAERLLLLAPPAARRYRDEGNPVGKRFLDGWALFDRHASPAARELIADLSADPGPLLAALGRLPPVGLHGDLKLANVALHGPSDVLLIDWQMTCHAPVAVELGWLLVSNVELLPEPPEPILERYRRSVRSTDVDRVVGDWDAQVDLALIVGLLLRGWRKGLDADARATLASGTPARDDLAWWSAMAPQAAARRL